MQVAQCASSIELRSKGIWTLTLLAIGLTTTLIGISPLGISIQTSNATLFIETGFLGGLAGCSLATAHLARVQVPLGRAPAFRRLQFEIGTILTSTATVALGAIIPLLIVNPSHTPVLALTTLLAHLSAMGLVFTRLPLGQKAMAALLPLIIWSAQAFLGPNDPRVPIRLLRTALDPTQNSVILSYAEALSTPLLISVTPIIGLLGLRAALDSLDITPNMQ